MPAYACAVPVTIRTYEQRDAADLADVFFRSVRNVALSDYTAAQVAAWAPVRPAPERLHEVASDGRLTLVAVNDQDRAVAFIDLEPDGHIDHLFCAPEAAGHGIASRLYEAVEAAAREQGINRLFTEASELARRVFERKGFVLIERQDKALRGVPIHNYTMAKDLPVTLSRTVSISNGQRSARASAVSASAASCPTSSAAGAVSVIRSIASLAHTGTADMSPRSRASRYRSFAPES